MTYIYTYNLTHNNIISTLRLLYPPDDASFPLVFTRHAMSAATQIVTDATKTTTNSTTNNIPKIAPDTGPEELDPPFAGVNWDEGPILVKPSKDERKLDRTWWGGSCVLCPLEMAAVTTLLQPEMDDSLAPGG